MDTDSVASTPTRLNRKGVKAVKPVAKASHVNDPSQTRPPGGQDSLADLLIRAADEISDS
jgi:hypothetical protein